MGLCYVMSTAREDLLSTYAAAPRPSCLSLHEHLPPPSYIAWPLHEVVKQQDRCLWLCVYVHARIMYRRWGNFVVTFFIGTKIKHENSYNISDEILYGQRSSHLHVFLCI